jgi:hypothetical protein
MMRATHIVGDTIELTARFRELEPKDVKLVVKLPNGNRTEYIYGRHPQIKLHDGVYLCHVPALVPGLHSVQWSCGGHTPRLAEATYVVEQSAMA